LEHFLTAMRLVEAGARCVDAGVQPLGSSRRNFGALRQDLPLVDQGVSALIDDLYRRGLEKDVSVVVWGEFVARPPITRMPAAIIATRLVRAGSSEAA